MAVDDGLDLAVPLSRDGGLSWVLTGPGPQQVIDIAAPLSAAETVYAGTEGGLMQSTDAGQSWTLIGPSGVAATMVEATADGAVYVFFAGTGLFKVHADGKWAELANTFGEQYLLHLAADPANAARLVAVTGESAVLESRDGGRNWQAFGQ